MNEITKLDFSRLLGFASASDRLSNGVDFRDDTFGAKLGAKVGGGEPGAQLDLSRLLGFAALGVQKRVDFQDEVFDGQLGAKVGVGEVWAPRELLHADDSSDQGLA